MVVKGVGNLESIYFSEDPSGFAHSINMEMAMEDAAFVVTCCCNAEFCWQFAYSKSDYEAVKHLIVDCIPLCDNIEELCDMLSDIFMDSFGDILIEDDEDDECDGDCANCMFKIDDSEYLQ